MRDIRIYHPETVIENESIFLTEESSHHLAVVLRAKEGDKIFLFDGLNQQSEAIIIKIQKKRIQVHIEKCCYLSKESPLQIHLALGISKGDRMTFSIQKAVELGVTAITPLWTQHAAFKWDSHANQKKLQSWHNIIISACEQSGRNFLPHLNPIIHFEDFIKQHQAPNKFILNTKDGKRIQQIEWMTPLQASLLIGPEGGFSQMELELAEQIHYKSLTLGPRILRTETAVLTALSIIQAYKGDL